MIVDKLLQELNLGSSELADPATALELGKVLQIPLARGKSRRAAATV